MSCFLCPHTTRRELAPKALISIKISFCYDQHCAASHMQAPPTQDVTALLRAWTGGEEKALDRLLPVLYEELHRTARAYMRRERSGHTLQSTALVNEVFLRL